RLGLPYAEPFTFLALRMVIASLLLAGLALMAKAPWPRGWRRVGQVALAGLLIHAAYLGGVFSAIELGMGAGVAALIVGTQPLLTAVLAPRLLGERITPRQGFGFALGLVGVALVVGERLGGGTTTPAGVACTGVALLGITLGTLYQKRYGGGVDLRVAGAIQYAATALMLYALALAFETRQIHWSGEFVFALAWLVLVLSVGAVGLLYTLIQRGAASRVASLFYLTPPLTALIAWALFGETLGPTALVGMAVVVAAVALVNAPQRQGRQV
ncbi:MAG: DMT family transporter, partial [Candidatus Competibacteraceae bacterium]|nr:DMT family transporter [Candidatus Competibacteraceae bacterium]